MAPYSDVTYHFWLNHFHFYCFTSYINYPMLFPRHLVKLRMRKNDIPIINPDKKK